jgi:hypothetical protein
MNSVYKINKGINKSIEFRGLKAQYISYLGGGLVALMILFAGLYILGISPYICAALIGIGGTALFILVYRMSSRYGEHGLQKKMAKKRIPGSVKCRSRTLFYMGLKRNQGKT